MPMTIIITENPEDLQTMLTEVDRESSKIGLHMNLQKTKIMSNGNPQITITTEEKY